MVIYGEDLGSRLTTLQISCERKLNSFMERFVVFELTVRTNLIPPPAFGSFTCVLGCVPILPTQQEDRILCSSGQTQHGRQVLLRANTRGCPDLDSIAAMPPPSSMPASLYLQKTPNNGFARLEPWQ